MNPEQPRDSGLDPTAQRVAEFVVRELHAEEMPASRAFALRLANVRRIQRHRRWLLAAAAVTLVLVAGIAGWRARGGQPPVRLSYRVNDQAPLAGGYVFAPRAADSLLSFSDGSKVRMSARARGRVVEITSDGARFALEEGNATVDIRPHARGRWLFEAGPFLVKVHGTSFTLDWHPAETVFELRLRSGAVSVANPVSGSELQLRSGQTLRVSLREQTTTLGVLSAADGGPAPAASANPLATAAGSAGPAPPTTLPEQPAESARWSHRGWPAALKEGKASTVVSEADRVGVAQVLARADGEDLWALANAARYAGRFALAEQALMTQRTRFPSSPRAREAAFLLGRLHDGDAGGLGNALTWYERYLTEAPTGTHVSDALGRKMTLLQRWDRRAEAVVVAKEYLRRFPAGTYANAARTLIRAETKGQ
jgi:TolA-binding protein